MVLASRFDTPDGIEVPPIDTVAVDPRLLAQARKVWASRTRSEYQSIQIITRLLSETLAAGESFAIQQTLLEMASDELLHAQLCAGVCRRLGEEPPAPADLAAPLPPLDEVPLRERVLASAISLFLVNETFSLGYIDDLVERCHHHIIGSVLGVIAGDEDEHEAFGEGFVGRRLEGETAAQRAGWRHFTQRLVRNRLHKAEHALADVAEERRQLDAWPETALAPLGLLGPQRLALLTLRSWERTLRPRLQRLQLTDADWDGRS